MITAFIYHPITMQQVIQIMLAKERKALEAGIVHDTQQQTENTQQTSRAASTFSHIQTINLASHTINTQSQMDQPKKICRAVKCRLLKAKGILPRPLYCMKMKDMCSGCVSKAIRHKKTKLSETDIKNNMASNSILSPLVEHLHTPTTIHQLKQLLMHLPTFCNSRPRDDHMFGALQYIANTLGLKLETSSYSDNIDQPPSEAEQKRLWRMANFQCRCTLEHRACHHFGARSMCITCLFPIHKTTTSHGSICLVCIQNNAWKSSGSACLACQLAAIVYRNSFQDRLQKQMELWLNKSESDTDSSSAEQDDVAYIPIKRPLPSHREYTEQQLFEERNRAFHKSFQEIRSRASIQQSRSVLEDLSVLHHTVRQNMQQPECAFAQ